MSIPPTPSTILTFGLGAYLAVAVAVYTDEPVVEHLACVPLHVHSTNEEDLEAGERAVASLRLALADLRTLYSSILSDKSRPRADFPFRNFFEANGCEHYFTYDEVIEDKRVFRAHLRCKEPTSLCIKFSRRYSKDAHEVAFDLGLAPKLYAVNHVYGWFMVVMEDASANYMTLCDLRKDSAIESARSQVASDLVRLHNKGFVHGDVRDVNILVSRPEAPLQPAIMLVDWDWAGQEGQAKYPHSMNPEVPRPRDATAGGLITALHDMAMVALL